MSKPHKSPFRAALFAPQNLSSEIGIESVLAEIDGAIHRKNYEIALLDAMATGDNMVLPLILARAHDCYAIKEWILQDIPKPSAFPNSFTAKLIHALSLFFCFRATPPLKDEHHIASNALELLPKLEDWSFMDESRTRKVASSVSKEKSKEHQENNRKRHLKHIMTDEHERLFTALSIDPPVTPEEHTMCVESLMATLDSLLRLYLERIGEPDVVEQITSHFISYRVVVPDPASLPQSASANIAPAASASDFSVYKTHSPLKPNLNVHKPEGFGNWTIILATSNSRSDIRQWHRRDQKVYETLEMTLRELSLGHFSYDNQKPLSGPDTEVPIYEAKVTGDLRLYTIDCVSLYDEKGETQGKSQSIVRVFGLFTHAQLKRAGLWQRVANHLGKRGPEHTKRCGQRNAIAHRDNYYDPITFPELSSPAVQEPVEEDIPEDSVPPDEEEDLNEAHQLVSLNKYVPLSQALLQSILNDTDASFPFQISWDEREIIEWTKSCIVLGRSGTGKTTTMLFKMLGLERAYQISCPQDGALGASPPRPRQMFVTQSRVLAGKVKEQFFAYMDALSMSSEEFQGMVEEHKKRARGAALDGDLVAEDDKDDWAEGLPKRFSELEDKDFPLFITYNQLCSMIEGDLEEIYEQDNSERRGWQMAPWINGRAESERFVAVGKKMKGKLVTFRRFLSDYWPHFTQAHTRRLNPSVVFSEIVGVIFGSEKTVAKDKNQLDVEKYKMRRGYSSYMPSDLVAATYSLAEQYDKMKRDWDDFDISDRTHAILKAIKKLRPQQVDYIYVDESQDNLIIDILLLRFLCRDPDGMFWAGDTAQTIFMGSSMRFEELKALLYRYEEYRHKTAQGKSKSNNTPPPEVPRMFHLSVNYRSHAGIVNCAHTIVELITKFWPDSIDKLNRERGQVDGQKPIFYTDTPRGFFESGQFLSKSATSGQRLEMGAEQCIIVRDEQAKKELRDKIGDVGIILTLYQSKGLEFNDVLLYNFFQDSAVEASAWRVVLSLSAQAEGPIFDAAKHAPLCHELKCLYVAITRARNVLRIADESNKGDSLKELWIERNQVLSRRPDDVADFAVQSRQEEWAAAADRLFKNDQYEEARRAYARANMTKEENVAKAYHLREQAQSVPAGFRAKKQNEQQFAVAARAFASCAEEGAEKKTTYHRLAAECFQEAGEVAQAAKHYDLGARYEDAAKLYRTLNKFDKLFDILVKHKNEMDKGFVDTLKDVVRLYYVKRKDFQRVHQLFESVEEELEYLDDRGLDYVQIDLMISHGLKADAANIHAKEGRYLDAIDLFLEDTSRPEESLERAKETVFEALWTLYPLGVVGEAAVDSYAASDIFERAQQITTFSDAEKLELEMFSAVRSNEFSPCLSIAGELFRLGRRFSGFFCLDHYFSGVSFPDGGDIAQLCEHLQHVSEYVHLLHDIVFFERPSAKEIQSLFGIRKRPQGDFVVLESSPLTHDQRVRDSNHLLSNDQFLDCFSEVTKARLLEQVLHENRQARQTPILSPCLAFIITACKDPECTKSKVHVTVDLPWYNLWIKAHLLQIGIFHMITKVWDGSLADLNAERKYWMQKLHGVLRPRSHEFGSLASLRQDLVEELKPSLRVLVEWNRDIAYKLTCRSGTDPEFFPLVIQTADIAFTFDRRLAANYVSNPPFLLDPKSSTHQIWRKLGGNKLLGSISCFGLGRKALVDGTSFIDQVIERKIPINLNVFLTFIERLCGFLIAAKAWQERKTLHLLMLPRSWLFEVSLAAATTDILPALDTSCMANFVTALGKLLRDVWENKSIYGDLYGSKTKHTKTDSEASLNAEQQVCRITSMTRICTALGILTLNDAGNIQRLAWTSVRSIYKPGQLYDPFILPFAEAREPKELMQATVLLLKHSPFNPIIYLYDRKLRRPSPMESPNVLFEHPGDILRLLSQDEGGLPAPFELGEADNNAIKADAGLTTNRPTAIANDGSSSEAREIYSQEDITIIQRSQKVYRRKLMNRQLAQRTTLAGQTTHHYLSCNHVVRSEKWPRSRYRLLFLGPLPNLLSALDSLRSLILAQKAELKSRLTDETSKDGVLEDVSNSLTRVAKLMKDIERFQRKLRPDSRYHSHKNVTGLTGDIGDALLLFNQAELPCALPDDLKEDLDLIFKGVIKERNPLRDCIVIQRAFRNYQRMKKVAGVKDSPRYQLITKVYTKYLPLVNPTMPHRYKHLVLGVLPDVMLLLEQARIAINADIPRLRGDALWQATRAQANALRARQEQTESLVEEIEGYIAELDPDGVVHTQFDVETCKWLILEALRVCREYESVDGEPVVSDDGYKTVVDTLSRF